MLLILLLILALTDVEEVTPFEPGVVGAPCDRFVLLRQQGNVLRAVDVERLCGAAL